MAYPILFKMTAPDEKTAIHIKADVSRGVDIIFDKVQTPGNNFTGRYVKNDKGDVTLNLKGSMLNMAEIFDMPLFKRETQRTADADQKSATQTKPVTAVPDLTFDIRLDTLTLKKNEPLTNVRVSGKRRGLYWQSLSAYLLANKPLSVNFTPETKILNGSTEDFGDVLNRLGVSERVRGGKLYFELTQRKNTGVMTGNLQVKNFEIGQTGFLTQALTILGIVDAIRGKELSFKKAIVPLTIMPAQSIKITEGYMYGTAVGITFDGTVTREKLNLSGSVIPAYAINSLPGKIPFIGQIFKNGAGGGLMGLKYEVTGGLFSPIVTFNPLASVAPGILGKLFN